MSKEVTLRELARIYARGGIDRSHYHKSRSELIKGIVEGRIEVKDIEKTSPLKKDKAISEAGQGEKRDDGVTQIRPEIPMAGNPQSRPDTNRKLLLIFVGIGAAILAILIVLAVLLIQNS